MKTNRRIDMSQSSQNIMNDLPSMASKRVKTEQTLKELLRKTAEADRDITVDEAFALAERCDEKLQQGRKLRLLYTAARLGHPKAASAFFKNVTKQDKHFWSLTPLNEQMCKEVITTAKQLKIKIHPRWESFFVKYLPSANIDELIIQHASKSMMRYLPKSLTKLHVRKSPVENEGLMLLAKHDLSHCKELVISKANIVGARGLKELLQKLPNLKSLVLSCNNMGDKGLKAVAENVSKTVTYLDVSGNNIRHAGIDALASRGLPALEIVDIAEGRPGIGSGVRIDQKLMEATVKLAKKYASTLRELRTRVETAEERSYLEGNLRGRIPAIPGLFIRLYGAPDFGFHADFGVHAGFGVHARL